MAASAEADMRDERRKRHFGLSVAVKRLHETSPTIERKPRGGGWPPRALFCPGSATGPVQVRLMSVNAWFQITLKPRLAAPPHDGMEPKHPVFGGAVNRRIRGVRARRCVAASR